MVGQFDAASAGLQRMHNSRERATRSISKDEDSTRGATDALQDVLSRYTLSRVYLRIGNILKQARSASTPGLPSAPKLRQAVTDLRNEKFSPQLGRCGLDWPRHHVRPCYSSDPPLNPQSPVGSHHLLRRDNILVRPHSRENIVSCTWFYNMLFM